MNAKPAKIFLIIVENIFKARKDVKLIKGRKDNLRYSQRYFDRLSINFKLIKGREVKKRFLSV
ncbi:hypothetical protein IO89_01255 [Epilithonimonas lactis]|uniref:Uncharacterized protein n=1 Tax=Epilithonimonas lactis TaxID=421072 RepID=A0A085BLA4_9FLAO|nr:hypothetical protein IO89_01255 [Epilithonimonas lactis]